MSASSREEPKALYSGNRIALFSASKQTHCRLVVCDFEWVAEASFSAFLNSHRCGLALFGCYMAGATWYCCCFGTRSFFKCYFIRIHTGMVHVWSAVTCYLHRLQNDLDLSSLHTTAVTRVWNWYRAQKKREKKDRGEENSPAVPAGTRTRHLWPDESGALPLTHPRFPYLLMRHRSFIGFLALQAEAESLAVKRREDRSRAVFR